MPTKVPADLLSGQNPGTIPALSVNALKKTRLTLSLTMREAVKQRFGLYRRAPRGMFYMVKQMTASGPPFARSPGS